MRKKVLIGVVVAAALVLAASVFIGSGEKAQVTIVYKNVSEVTLTEVTGQEYASSDDTSVNGKEIRVTQSGEKVELTKNVPYILRYQGADGYADGEQVINIDGDETIELNPSYSEEKLNQILQVETPSIQATLNEKYPKINLYKIQPGKLYQWGDWYGTTLIYTGPYTPYRDTLRLVMKKENGSWKIMTDPPYISLSRYSYPDIPVEILDEVNNLETPKPEER